MAATSGLRAAAAKYLLHRSGHPAERRLLVRKGVVEGGTGSGDKERE